MRIRAAVLNRERENRSMSMNIDFDKSGGLVPAIIQDHLSGEVLMLGFMNQVSLAETQRTGEVVFFSRSRNKLWKKGESSGHVLKLRELRVDCDADALLVKVEALGPGVCHEGYRSCFFRKLSSDGTSKITDDRTFAPESVYGSAPGKQEKK
ncbi:MAG TPA: phosphoribosyl-AMP cyclohydrolase [Candidatus Acidoferrum sp.]|nr:phosphoribosyl-AMP cyclohydrolase [Candidatus Acidoferrum sp.]